MVRVIGIDPGTVSLDLFGLEGERVWLDRSLPTADALRSPELLIDLLREAGPLDLIAGPSGYGLPMVPAASVREEDLRLAYLSAPGDPGGIGGLTRLARALVESRLPVCFTPGVIHLPTVPRHRKLNRVDLGTADKVAAAALGIWDQCRRAQIAPENASFILVDLGGGFTALVGVRDGQVVDGIGGTGGPMGWQSSGGWDGEVAFLAGRVEKAMLFSGGVTAWQETQPTVPRGAGSDLALTAYVEGIFKAVLALTASVPQPREILLSGRHAGDSEIRRELESHLSHIAPVRDLRGFTAATKQGAQGSAIIAEGMAGGRWAPLIDCMRLRDATGTSLDYLRVIGREQARHSLGLA